MWRGSQRIPPCMLAQKHVHRGWDKWESRAVARNSFSKCSCFQKLNTAEVDALNTKVTGLTRCKNDSFLRVTVLNQLTDNRKTYPTDFCFHNNGPFKTALKRQRRRVKLTLASFHNNSSPRTTKLKFDLFGQRKRTNVAYSKDKQSERKELP